MSSDQVENKILLRIKKMLATANCAGATEAERDTAMRMAHNLLAKHNLSTADLPADQNNEPREGQEFTMCADIWARSVASAVAKLFFCEYYFLRVASCKDTHCFIGKQSNVVTAQYMAEFVIKSLKKEASRRYKSPTSPEGRSFCVGAKASIWVRVKNLMATNVQDDNGQDIPGSALILANSYKVEEDANRGWLTVQGIIVSVAKSRPSTVNLSAYGSGKEFGKTVSLSTQLGTSASVKHTAIKG